MAGVEADQEGDPGNENTQRDPTPRAWDGAPHAGEPQDDGLTLTECQDVRGRRNAVKRNGMGFGKGSGGGRDRYYARAT